MVSVYVKTSVFPLIVAADSTGATLSKVTGEPVDTIDTLPLLSVAVATKDFTPSAPKDDNVMNAVPVTVPLAVATEVTHPVPNRVPEVEVS